MGQEITLPKHIKVQIWNGHWTRQDAIDNPNKLFLFGGNILQDHFQALRVAIPSVTQAVIRGLPNAIAINTKWSNGKLDSAYFNDKEFEDFETHLEISNDNINWYVHSENFSTIILPSKENGIGTGTAYLQQKAPKCWELLQTFLAPLYERAEKSVISEN